MKHTKEEILHALTIIKEECAVTDCHKCPFGTKKGTCNIYSEIPDFWQIKTEEKEKTWRAFEE